MCVTMPIRVLLLRAWSIIYIYMLDVYKTCMIKNPFLNIAKTGQTRLPTSHIQNYEYINKINIRILVLLLNSFYLYILSTLLNELISGRTKTCLDELIYLSIIYVCVDWSSYSHFSRLCLILTFPFNKTMNN